ncbi:hypothetical protein BU16DRAFT_202905 [Lophium mytilinum]|uniref:Secreted protein n=1 Tax=Lophium mytilinum TaxID=390894 RepID=A0A6A6RDQ0_9PEZI|nr:hypothetical protein BU16DRAFT_202905 [Lophium mytilinum]
MLLRRCLRRFILCLYIRVDLSVILTFSTQADMMLLAAWCSIGARGCECQSTLRRTLIDDASDLRVPSDFMLYGELGAFLFYYQDLDINIVLVPSKASLVNSSLYTCSRNHI